MEPSLGPRGHVATTAVRAQVRLWSTFYTTRVLWSADDAPSPPPPSEARVLDALEARAVADLAQRGAAPHGLAAGLTVLDAIERLRRETGFVAAPAEDLTPPHRVIARQVYAAVRDAIDALPALPWAQALAAAVVAATGRAGDADRSGGRPTRRARELRRVVADHLAATGAGALVPRVARVLHDAEVQAVVDLRLAVARAVDPRDALDQLAAITRLRRVLHLDRAQLVAQATATGARANDDPHVADP